MNQRREYSIPWAVCLQGDTGVHRFQLDCHQKLGHTSGTADGFQGNITMIINISNPAHPREVGHYIPRPEIGEWYAQSNDVFADDRGLIYLTDRARGFDILRFSDK
jgi:hypothetical protein